jgi:raffinose/stachyose/melibiose transport system permease protein
MKKLKPTNSKSIGFSLLMWFVVALFIVPFYVLIVYSLKPRSETMLARPLSLPKSFYLGNFSEAIARANLDVAFKNSAISTVMVILILVVVSSMAAYIIARSPKSRFYGIWQYIFLAAIMVPFQTIMFPLYSNLVQAHMLNKIASYVLIMSGLQLPFNIFLYIGFIKTVPLELEEAAEIDGCSKYRTFWQITFPLLKPITMTVIVLTSLAVWNDYQVALVVIRKSAVMTLPLAQQQFITAEISYLNLASASCLISILPVFIMYLFLQKFIAGGIVAGAIKG